MRKECRDFFFLLSACYFHPERKYSSEEVKDLAKQALRLPEGPEGDERLEKLLSGFGEEFTAKERLFILFYTNPLSKTLGKINPSGQKAGGSWKG